MSDFYIYNSLTRKKEQFVPMDPSRVGVYMCGPTVYSYATIGNFRTYTTGDVLLRVLKFNGFNFKYIMNITDVGHLTGDNQGDADTGEDRMEKTALKEGKDIWDVAKFYTDAFVKEFELLNLTKPDQFTKATDHIPEQIKLVKELEEKGFTYNTSDGVYFDTTIFEKKTGKKYGELSTLDEIQGGARVEVNPEKKNIRDFALWKFSPGDKTRQMEWESPWGKGFPGWHIECSAMSMKYLGETFDIHLGGEDLRSTHHPNEIAQSEAATGVSYVKYWVHGAFLKVDGGRMGKSLGNAYTVDDVVKRGYDPLALRYFYLTGHYRDPINFTWDALEGANTALSRLYQQINSLRDQKDRTALFEEKQKSIDTYSFGFRDAINNDLNTSQAIAVLWEALKSNIPSSDKYDLAMDFDEVLGLKLDQVKQVDQVAQVEQDVEKLLKSREELRKEGEYEKADEVRREIEDKGYVVEDGNEGVRIKRISNS
jgi:cysteinyl-tRNA synthetase